MKKTLIALAALGAAVSVHATNITVYGVADIGYSDGPNTEVGMSEKVNSRLGVKGSEDLGNGLKAIFQLEQRFDLADGTASDHGDFEGAANVGLAGDFGKVRLGRLNELSTETLRKLDPFNQYGVAGAFEITLPGNDGSGRLNNAVRYDSPVMNGLQFGISYSFYDANVLGATDDDGYAISATYKNDDLYLVANYNHMTNLDDTDNWNIGASYDIDGVTISALYEDANVNLLGGMNETHWMLGVSWKVGNGVVKASYNDGEASSPMVTADSNQWAIGYQHNLSKRTSLYIDIAVVDSSYESASYTILTNDGTHWNIGVTHKF